MERGGQGIKKLEQEYWETNEWLAHRVFEHITKYIGEVFKESCRQGYRAKAEQWRKWVRNTRGVTPQISQVALLSGLGM